MDGVPIAGLDPIGVAIGVLRGAGFELSVLADDLAGRTVSGTADHTAGAAVFIADAAGTRRVAW
ncbi:hypothetical protein [Dactylosporangium sp. NPDC000521]|uniref:hypothetical protein n=1 Tax=Dactylosporangium sp. NPDC000521 TaxID=3363975 RepID=UPI0036749DB6